MEVEEEEEVVEVGESSESTAPLQERGRRGLA